MEAPWTSSRRYVVGVTGASGIIYAARLIDALLADASREVHLIVTPAAHRVIYDELEGPAQAGASLGELKSDEPQSPIAGRLKLYPNPAGRIIEHSVRNIGAGPASGTFKTEAMIVVPCSMNTLAAISHGISDNLLTRAAAVTLKEGRPLILVPRETPLTLIDLRNMTAAAEAGAVILPASPGFYHRPRTIEDLIRHVVQKVFDRLGLAPQGQAIRWPEIG
jgi:4-hydroxy-3-polyprenylbenzoate decarboxylase